MAKGAEKYEHIKEAFAEVFSEINNLQEKGCIEIEGKAVPVELFLGGDYKVLTCTVIFV